MVRMNLSINNPRVRYLLPIVFYFLWYQSMKPLFGYSSTSANWNPALVALLFSLVLVAGFLAWALYFDHKAEKPAKAPIAASVAAAAAFTAMLTSFPGVPSILFMCGAALCSASIPVRSLTFMFNNLPKREYGLTTCIGLALPTAFLFTTLEFASSGSPGSISTRPGIYNVVIWVASLAVLVSGFMTITLPAERVAIEDNTVSANSVKPFGVFGLIALICFVFFFVTAFQDNTATEIVDKSGRVYEELFFIAVFIAAGMLCDLKGWHITMYAGVALIIVSLFNMLVIRNTSGIALSNAGSAAFDAAFLFMFMDISHRFKKTAFLLPLAFALPGLFAYTAFILNCLTGKRSDLPALLIICGAAIALLPLITVLLKNLSTLEVQKADEKMPADNNTAGASMLLHSETSVIELNNGQNILQEITKRYALTPREAEVLKLTLEGQSAEEMAQNLCITQRTVRAHIGSVLKKTGAKNRLQLISTLLLEKES